MYAAETSVCEVKRVAWAVRHQNRAPKFIFYAKIINFSAHIQRWIWWLRARATSDTFILVYSSVYEHVVLPHTHTQSQTPHTLAEKYNETNCIIFHLKLTPSRSWIMYSILLFPSRRSTDGSSVSGWRMEETSVCARHRCADRCVLCVWVWCDVRI